jgi:hypothetical protein
LLHLDSSDVGGGARRREPKGFRFEVQYWPERGKEALVRLRICVRSQCGPSAEAVALAAEANELVAILTAIIRNTRKKLKA